MKIYLAMGFLLAGESQFTKRRFKKLVSYFYKDAVLKSLEEVRLYNENRERRTVANFKANKTRDF